MNTNFIPPTQFTLFLRLAGAFILCAAAPVFAAAKTKIPLSKFFVTDVQGQVEINIGNKIESLAKKTVHSAQGTIIETQKTEGENQRDKNFSSVVYSNGTGIFFDDDTRLEMKKFVQESFEPNRTDMDVEPSISQTQALLSRGSVALCVSKMVAGSTMVYETPHATINIRGRKIIIETNEKFTKVSVIEGESTVRGGTGSSIDLVGKSLQAGQQAIIRPGVRGEPPVVQVIPIPPREMGSLDDKISMAYLAQKTIYFDVIEGKTGAGLAETSDNSLITAFDYNGGPATGQELVPVEIVPANLPVQYTVSPARLTPR